MCLMKGPPCKSINIWSGSLSNVTCSNPSANIPQLSTPANQTLSGHPTYPQISSLHISESNPRNSETRAESPPHVASRFDNPLESRIFGRDMRRLVKVVHAAILNPGESMETISTIFYSFIQISDTVYVPWDVQEYYVECVKARAEKREKNKFRFPAPSFGSYDHPLTIVDIRGRIVLWYLPGLLSIKQQVSLKKFNHCPESNWCNSPPYNTEP